MDHTLDRLSIHKVLLAATAKLASGDSASNILRAACDVLVAASPHVRLAWMYLGNPDADVIRPLYAAGPARAYASNLALDRSPAMMGGPVRTSLGANTHVIGKIRTDPAFLPWREAALESSLEEILALPFGAETLPVRGVVAIYADHPDYFEQVGLEAFAAFAHLGAVALEQSELKRNLQELATIDTLTRVLNRRAIQEIIDREHARATRQGITYSLLMIDVDRFKLINDSYGHDAGDAVLTGIAKVIQESLRAGDWLARWGGEEFLMLLPETDSGAAREVAERLRQRIARLALIVNEHHVNVTVSMGVVAFPSDGNTPHVLLKAADTALYHAKKSGRNRVIKGSERREVFSTALAINEALAGDRFTAAYQRIVNLHSGEQVAEEVLARMVNTRGDVSEASQFINVAVDMDIAHRIDYEMLTKTLRRCADGPGNSQAALTHFVNISSDLLRHPVLIRGLLENVEQTIAHCSACKTRCDGISKYVVMEIKERELLGDIEAIRDSLAPFVEQGFRLAVDNFGSGYSSFQYLADLPLSFLKIEGTLVRRVSSEPRVRNIVHHINDIAQDLGLLTIAEGVEDPRTADYLRDIGIDWGQGYHFGHPVLKPATRMH